MRESYEYAGFIYWVEREASKPVRMILRGGSAPRRSKEKHRRGALECFLQDEATL